MAIKQSRKNSKHLSRAKKLETNKSLTTPKLYQMCCSGQHIKN